MNAMQAMEEVVHQAQALSAAKRTYPPGHPYLARRQRMYDAAFRAYTDPFGVKSR